MLVRATKRKSLVWRYYGDVIDGKVECLLCHHILKFHASRSTSNLFKHLDSQHRTEAQEIVDASGRSYYRVSRMTPKPSDGGKAKRSNQQQNLSVSVSSPVTDVEMKIPNDVDQNPVPVPQNSVMIPMVHPRKSKVWKLFTVIPNPNSNSPRVKSAVCSICNIVLTYNNGSSSNLRKHIRHRHPSMIPTIANEEGDAMLQPIPPTTSRRSTSSFRQSTSYSQVDRKSVLDRKVISMIAADLQPVSMVERKGFIDLMATAVPSYTLPSSKTVTTELLPKLYKDAVDSVLERLQEIHYVALTTDSWSPRKQEIYLSVTGHFISPTDWTLQSVMLSTTTFYGNPSAKDIASELQRVVTEWNLSDKITVMVTDNETNNLLANEQLPWAYIPCLGQLLHLVVTDAIAADKEASTLIEKVNDVVNFFQHNQEATENLATTQQSLGTLESEAPDCKLFASVPQRWNSIIDMLEGVNDYFDAINTVLEVYELADKCLSLDEGDMIKRIISSLKPFRVVTASLSSNDNNANNINMAMPLIKGLMKMMATVSDSKESLTENLRQGLTQSFGKIEEIDCIIAASILDPRFKRFPFAAKDVIEKAKEVITTDVSKLLASEESNADGGDASNSTASTTIKSAVMDPFWDLLDTMTTDFQGVREVITPAANREVQRYLESPPVPKDENILVYWKQHSELYPNLCKIAMKYLTVPITSVPFDRLFTKAGDALLHSRSTLKPSNVNMILFLNKNF